MTRIWKPDVKSADGLSRRKLLGSAAAFGVLAAAATTFAPSRASAQEPKRGGHLKLGLKGGAATDTLDPAGYSAGVAFVTGRCWGDTLVESHPNTGVAVPALAESWEASADAETWSFKIRKDVQFHDGSPMTIADVLAR